MSLSLAVLDTSESSTSFTELKLLLDEPTRVEEPPRAERESEPKLPLLLPVSLPKLEDLRRPAPPPLLLPTPSPIEHLHHLIQFLQLNPTRIP